MAGRLAGSRYTPFPREALAQSIQARFEQQVASGPERLAVKSGPDALTYEALNRHANRVARSILAALGPKPEPVALLIEQGASLVAAILATLKGGKIYVPLDPSFPPAHLAGQLEDSGARLVLTSARSGPVARAVAGDGRQFLAVDAPAADVGEDNPRLTISPDTGAYIFYTSGSTGRPKGVLDTHRNVLHNVMRYTNTLCIGVGDRFTLLQGPSFSGAVSSLFGALLNGAAVFPFDVPHEGADRIRAWLAAERITIYHSVPALFRRVAEGDAPLPALRIVRLEGDRAAPRDVELFRQRFPPGAVLVNGLGATECGLVRQFFVDHDTTVPDGVVPIGYPVEDMDVVLLDESGGPVATGEIGEITVRSRYLAEGYWRQPELTASSFRRGPGGVRTYRTGDLGRLRADGCLEHLGRKDFQLKIGGNRVEAAEVEAALLEVPGVKEATVATREGRDGEPRLVAYVVPTEPPGPTVTAIRRHLTGQLPGYMVPSAFVTLRALPLDANAKVDRRALPAPGTDRPHLDLACIQARDVLQQQLIDVWERVLAVRPVGIRDDFFDLGGSSLLALEMADEVARLLGLKVPLTAMLECSTVEHLAEVIQGKSEGLAEPVGRVQAGGSLPPLFFLHGDYLSGGFFCTELARRLGPDQPFFALPPFGLRGEPIPDSYEAMAELHLAALRTVQPAGPYRLGGVCNGGLVALEMARRLLAAGERVDRLCLIGATAMNVRWKLSLSPIATGGWWMRRQSPERFDDFLAFVHHWDSLGRSARARLLLGRVRKTARRLAARSRPPRMGGTGSPPPSALSELRARTREVYRRLDRDYTPAAYPGCVTVLWPAEDIERFRAARWWSKVARQVNFRFVPGSHATSLTRHVDALAHEIRRCLGDDATS
jgi:amino acid adenylation domain-containing protein